MGSELYNILFTCETQMDLNLKYKFMTSNERNDFDNRDNEQEDAADKVLRY